LGRKKIESKNKIQDYPRNQADEQAAAKKARRKNSAPMRMPVSEVKKVQKAGASQFWRQAILKCVRMG
jgi:hypothetical protein